MSDEQVYISEKRTGSLWRRLVIVLMGIVAGQFILYGPSLVGRKVLLPLDLLAVENVYLPMTPEFAKIVPHDHILADLVLQFEPTRQFAISELRAGRLPQWTPYQYAGAPVVSPPKFSPFQMLEYCTRSPLILAWTQLFAALVAGFGAYIFCRRVLSVSFWAAAIPSWCYPLTGFFVFWQGSSPCNPVYWFPWLLLAVDRTVRRASPWAAAGLSVVTGLVLTSGSLDVSGQALLASGFYAVWCLLDVHRKQWFQRPAQRAVSTVTMGWLLGFMFAAPYLLPLLEYAQTGARMERRAVGSEERPPVGLSALPQTVLPDMYGATRTGSLRLTDETQHESSATTYTGVLATLLVAPLAWCSRRHRSINLFWCLLGFFALSWSLNVPGLVALLRLPGLNLMSHNRFVFATSFAILAMTAIGLDALGQGQVRRRWWFWLPTGLLAGLFAWCLYRTLFLPEPIATKIGLAVNRGEPVVWVHDLDGVRQVQLWFVWSYASAAIFCNLGLMGWLFLWLRPAWSARAIPVLGILLIGDLLWFAHDRSAQCDPALYYPRIPALKEIAKSTPGRIVGFSCLPAMLAQMQGLQDIRGDDGVESKRLMDIMAFAADPRTPKLNYSMMQWFSPQVNYVPPDGVRLSPILDMFGVRYVIFRGTPPSGIDPAFQSPDYWVLVNRAALPRVFVPQHVEVVTDEHQRLEKLRSPQFDPRAVAYVEAPPSLPDACRGKAEITSEIPTRVTMSVQMETPGLVVLADLWDKGWKAYLNGRPVPILRADHAIRGVVVPAGATTLEFRYESESFALGLRLAGLAAMILLGWLGIAAWIRRGSLNALPPPALPQNPRSL